MYRNSRISERPENSGISASPWNARTVMAYFAACFADGDAVCSDGEMIFIFYFDAQLYIQVDKGLNVVLTAVNVIGHRIMGRI